MKKEDQAIVDEILKIKTKKDAFNVDDSKMKLLTNLARNGNKLANKALTHLCILVTPEDYDDDICD